MNSWQNSREPLSISIRCTSMLGWWIGSMNTVRPRCLGDVPVGPGQAQSPVGPPGARGPHLGAVQHPLVAVAHGRGEGAGDVGAAARLGEELHPELLALQDGGEVAQLLLLGAELEDDGGARRERRHLHPQGVLVADELLVEHLLVRRRQALARRRRAGSRCRPGRRRRACAGAPGRGRRRRAPPPRSVPLQLPAQLLGRDLPEVGPDEGPGPLPEALEVLQLAPYACSARSALTPPSLPVRRPTRRSAGGGPPACRPAPG